jgi:hypothetical protein
MNHPHNGVNRGASRHAVLRHSEVSRLRNGMIRLHSEANHEASRNLALRHNGASHLRNGMIPHRNGVSRGASPHDRRVRIARITPNVRRRGQSRGQNRRVQNRHDPSLLAQNRHVQSRHDLNHRDLSLHRHVQIRRLGDQRPSRGIRDVEIVIS